MHAIAPGPGLLVVDAALNVMAFNGEAIQILTFPEHRDKITDLKALLTDQLQSSLLDRSSSCSSFFREFRSARRTYQCRYFSLSASLNGSNGDARPAMLVMLERKSNDRTAVAALSQRFGLTAREEQTVQLLVEGLTSKEIAVRMKISPNTVKGFLRIIMVKMNVSTRSGIIGKILETEKMTGHLPGNERPVQRTWPVPERSFLVPR
jgi:DNA-binding CsgD family transcriptional regulator